jgi:hypothetical protein
MKYIITSFLIASIAAASVQAAATELNVADGSIESPDGLFIGRDFAIVDGFKLELLYRPSTTEGRWVALDWDNQGRLLLPSYNSDRFARLTIPRVGSADPVRVEMIDTTRVGAAEGVLNAFGGIYINVNRSQTIRSGLYKITDSNNDGVFDTTRVLRVVQGDGSDHGTHTLRLSPDRGWITMMNGNATRPTEFTSSRVPLFWGEDNLVTRLNGGGPGFNRAPEGNVMNYSPDASEIELFAMGFRNPVSNAYNKDGELFLYDADHEPDFGGIGYRPTNMVHVMSGGDSGWRAGPRVQPFWRFDFIGDIGIVGAGSPTGGVFGTGAKFPARYQDSYFICDWSFGYLYAVHIVPNGSSYTADVQHFIEGRPFAVSGAIVNLADGSLLVVTTGTELYRVTYVGQEDTSPTRPDARYAAMRDTRKYLASFHGRQDPLALDAAWSYLNDQDEAIRYAARVAVEWQPVDTWRDRALAETNPRRSIAAIAALARASGLDEYHTPTGTPPTRNPALQARMLASLNRIAIEPLSYQDKLDLMRAYQLVMIRLGRPSNDDAQRLIARLDPLFPASHAELNLELAELMSYLNAPSAPAKILALIQNAPGQPYYGLQEWINPELRQRRDRGDITGPNLGVTNTVLAKQKQQMTYAQFLRVVTNGWNADLRTDFLEYFATAPQEYQGSTGNTSTSRGDFVALMSDSERAALQTLIETPMPTGRGGGGRGNAGGVTPGVGGPPQNLYISLGRNRPFTDIELTRLSQFDESVERQIAAQAAARDALVAATFADPVNANTITLRARELAQAELALANAQADGFASVIADLNLNSQERLLNAIGSINNRGGRGFAGINAPAGGGFGGGGGGGGFGPGGPQGQPGGAPGGGRGN